MSADSRPVAVVSGGTSGIGRAVALRLAASHGYTVVAFGNVAAEVDVMRQEHPDIDLRTADVSDAAQVDALIADVLARHGRIDGLVNAAAVMTRGTALEVDEAAWDRTFDINVKGVYLLTRRVLPAMIAAGGGAVVNFASPSGNGGTDHLAYCASKGAIMALTTSLALDHLADHVRVNAVIPGSTRTGMNRDRSEEMHRRIGRTNVSGRVNDPDDVARAVAFLLGRDSATISGAFLDVGAVSGQMVVIPKAP
ncbi:SDR family NAD(P)-dependent oxidoreductase [Pseudonocardia benzenivorans]|uniref:SDR family NAD(P)-dependent oxidoreductase n=1 Tax=Pseudonocardia benzenivorans TaxID=228005 RepID=A0ABW3VS36_9PSEU